MCKKHIQLACVKHITSIHSGPGSNPKKKIFNIKNIKIYSFLEAGSKKNIPKKYKKRSFLKKRLNKKKKKEYIKEKL